MAKPPTPKKPALFNKILEELKDGEAWFFEWSPRSDSVIAYEHYRVAAIRKKYLELKTTIKLFESIYGDDLFVEEVESRFESLGYMRKEPIRTILKRAKNLIPIIDYLRSIMSKYRTEELQKLIPDIEKWGVSMVVKTTGREENRELALFCFEDDNYMEISDTLGCAASTIKKYLTAMAKVGIIRKVTDGRGGGETRTPTIYAFGYWLYVRSEEYVGPRFIPFLTRETSEMLHGFNLR